jgi:GTP-binding protein
MINTIAIVGRPNVGKSTLFNTLLNRNEALTSPNPGLTRDRTYSYLMPHGDLKYLLIDTGGLELDSGKAIAEKINLQVDIAIEQADLLLFVVDTKDGLLPMDDQIAHKLRKTKKRVITVINKSDSPKKDIASGEFYSLGFDEYVTISALAKRNISGVIDKIIKILPDSLEEEKQDENLTLCVIGRPNVGKSTLVNRLAGKERVIVSDVPGTTRNPAKCYIDINGRQWELVDLAGIWRRNRGKDVEEVISMIAARRELERANACIFMLDLSETLSFQDSRLAGWIIETATPVIIAGNKADLIEDEKDIKDLEESYHVSLLRQMPYINFAPFITISAKEGKGMKRIYDELEKVMANSFRRISQDELDALLQKILVQRKPPKAASVRPEVLKLVQERVNPPVFKLKVIHPRIDKIPQHWKNFVRNCIYKEYGYYGVPLTLEFLKAKGKIKKSQRI